MNQHARRLRQARETYGLRQSRRDGTEERQYTLTQQQLAERSGVSVRTIKDIEASRSTPTKPVRLCLASALLVAPSWLWDALPGSVEAQPPLRRRDAA